MRSRFDWPIQNAQYVLRNIVKRVKLIKSSNSKKKKKISGCGLVKSDVFTHKDEHDWTVKNSGHGIGENMWSVLRLDLLVICSQLGFLDFLVM